MRFLFACAVSALTVACYQAPQPECAFECLGNGPCPDGYTCRNDLMCRRDDVADSFVCPDIALVDAATPDGTDIDAMATDSPTDAADAVLVIENVGSAAFGSVLITTSAPQKTITVRNTGTTHSGPLEVTFTTDPNGTSLRLVAGMNACTDRVLAGVNEATDANSSTCTIAVGFQPESVQDYAATLQVSATPGGTQSLEFTGTGTAPPK